MDANPTPPTSAERAERQLRQLAELAELTLSVARALAEQALRFAKSAPVPNAPDPSIPLARLARSVRQTLALESKLDHDRRTHAQPRPNSYESDLVRRRGDHILSQSFRVRRAVEHIIDTETDPSDAENLLTDLYERLDDKSYAPTLARYRVKDIVTKLCRDLGLSQAETERTAAAFTETELTSEQPRLREPPFASAAVQNNQPPPHQTTGTGTDPPRYTNGGKR